MRKRPTPAEIDAQTKRLVARVDRAARQGILWPR